MNRSDNMKRYQASLTPEQRMENGRRAVACKSPEQRCKDAANMRASVSVEQRREYALKADAAMSPEQRLIKSEKVKTAVLARSPEYRKQLGILAASVMIAKTTPEQRSDRARKRWASMSPERRSEIGSRGAATKRAANPPSPRHVARTSYMFGITRDQVSVVLPHGRQTMCCICGSSNGKKSINVDHEHATGVVRGALCDYCNFHMELFDREDSKEIVAKFQRYAAGEHLGISPSFAGYYTRNSKRKKEKA